MRFLTLFVCVIASALVDAVYIPYKTYDQPVHAYHGPPAPLAHDGRVVDTPEVAHAKAAHLAAHAAEAAKATPHHGYSSPDYVDHYVHENYVVPVSAGVYHGPPAPLAHDGQVIDTPEVAHAKAAHFAAHAEEINKLAKIAYHEPYPHPAW